MFADDRNLFFFFNKDIKQLFQAVNFELENEDKPKYTLFNKSKNKDNIPLKPPKLYLNQKEIKRYHSIKFLG